MEPRRHRATGAGIHPTKSSLCILPDEDALNAILDGRIAELSPLWNMRARAWSHRRVRSAFCPVIVHYDGPNKPWKRFGEGRRPLQTEGAYRSYQRFLVELPWPEWLDDKWTLGDLGAGLAHEAGLWTNWLWGKEAPFERLRDERAYADAFMKYGTLTLFADKAGGIVEHVGGRLQLARRPVQASSLGMSQ